ncbi:hypothetical protein A3D54_01840 [Candidatus Falkowbacteria bacterium RIFCSPHIGHO2_02_FULL_45_15]|uniref:Uncharacterized protein n=1 Tax=Candidatus Falkowbacteria bacterium RIFCSPHIGHO2_02_FULL_45_15 TaxID=1797987 RepID=A0A1F5RXE6_9BACT|nr:MAG: hypothetical protein A3D54_01840 [Candidatus Falkowbacteria bacterium RIFCSPHIGHO2_02_FULL_45_15]
MAKKDVRIQRIQERREATLAAAGRIRSGEKEWKELPLEDRRMLLTADIIENEDRLEGLQRELSQEEITEAQKEENLVSSVFKGVKCLCCSHHLEVGESSILSADLVVSKAEQSGRKMPTKAHFLKKVAALEIPDFQATMCCRMCNPQVESWLSENLPPDSDRNNFRLHPPMNLLNQWAKKKVETAKRERDSHLKNLKERISTLEKNLHDLRSRRDSVRGVIEKKQEKTRAMNQNIQNALGFLSPTSSKVVPMPMTGTDDE